ncbi:hypothetical protein CapIbe_023543 [Capra ibex]
MHLFLKPEQEKRMPAHPEIGDTWGLNSLIKVLSGYLLVVLNFTMSWHPRLKNPLPDSTTYYRSSTTSRHASSEETSDFLTSH